MASPAELSEKSARLLGRAVYLPAIHESGSKGHASVASNYESVTSMDSPGQGTLTDRDGNAISLTARRVYSVGRARVGPVAGARQSC
jgi:hypothetical protein